MSTSVVDLLMHPVRIRIVNALYAGRTLTTAELRARMPGTSQATVYRHVAALAEGGVLEVDGEERVRGTVERRYRLREDQVRFDDAAAAAMSREDHRRVFTAAMAALLAEFNSYLDRSDANPRQDSVSYRQCVVWLSETELETLVAQVTAALTTLSPREPTADRTPYLLSTILFPAEKRGGTIARDA
ncbi:MAG: helix-turn-helix domain-containing protein [Gemmatimonadota bacterium]